MRKSKIIQFRVEECIGKELEAIAKKEDTSMTRLVYSGVIEILKKKLKGDFPKLEKKIEASVKLNAKVGRKPKEVTEESPKKEVKKEKVKKAEVKEEVKKVKKEEVKKEEVKEKVKKVVSAPAGARIETKKKEKTSRLAPRPAPKS
jgi:hypothetical protein